jgi:hypothetical protein
MIFFFHSKDQSRKKATGIASLCENFSSTSIAQIHKGHNDLSLP